MNDANQVRIRYKQLGVYKTTLIGVIQKWDGQQITILDESHKMYNLSLDNLIRIEPVINCRRMPDCVTEPKELHEQTTLDLYI